jgi:hypothetical protein
MTEQEASWEDKARFLRGGLRVLRAEMNTVLENEVDENDIDWYDEFLSVEESINELLKEVDSM